MMLDEMYDDAIAYGQAAEALPEDRIWSSSERLAYLDARLRYIGNGDLELCARLMWQWTNRGLITQDDFYSWCCHLDSE